MVDHLSSGMTGVIDIYIPPEENEDISRVAQLTLDMQKIEEGEVQNLEEKEDTIMGDGELATMVQHQEEEKVQKSMDK